MADLDPASIDVATLAWLAGSAANTSMLERLRSTGHDGVRLSHGYVVQQLIDGRPTVSELAAALGVTQQAASKHVLELERLGYVARRPDADDSRVRRVALTERGAHLVEESRKLRTELEQRLVVAVGSTAVDAARSALLALTEIVGATDDIAARRARPPSD